MFGILKRCRWTQGTCSWQVPTFCGTIANQLEIEASRPEERVFWQRRANAFVDANVALETGLAALIANETIRGFHYSRMTDEEVQAISHLGIILTSKLIAARCRSRWWWLLL